MNIPNEKTQRIMVHLVELRGPTRVGGIATLNRLQTGNDSIREMELLDRRGVIKVWFENGLVASVPLSNVGLFFEANEVAQAKFKPSRMNAPAEPVVPQPPKPVKSDVVKL